MRPFFLLVFALFAHASAQTATEIAAAVGGGTTHFIKYTGPQSREFIWLPNAAILSRTRFAVPVFLEYPDRPYEVIGTAWMPSPPPSENTRKIAIRSLAESALNHGADALLLNAKVPGRTDYYAAGTAIRWRK